MPSKRFEINYPDGSKKKISAFRFEQMRSSGEVKQISEQYRYAGPARTFHAFADLSQWQTQQLLNPEKILRYLDRLEVIFEEGVEREWQAEETPDGFKARLVEMGMPATGFLQVQT